MVNRPTGFRELIDHLDACGWSYGIRWANPDTNLLRLTVTGVPPWDEILRIEVSWLSRDGGPLKRDSATTRKPYEGETRDRSIQAVHAFITPEPAGGEAL